MPHPTYSKSPTSWRFWPLLLGICLIAGVILRGVNLTQKPYWYDETYTSLRISGYSETEVVQAISSDQVISVEKLALYQRLSERRITDTVRGLAQEEPQHTPLYFVLVRIWAEIFGDSIAAVRSLSVLLSLLALPAMAWLCWELFGSALAAWLGAVLLSVSPFQVIYAQEARPTALWTLTILLSSAALLRAMRLKTARSWWLYGGLLSINLYSYLFSGLVAIAHSVYAIGLYVIGRERHVNSTLRWFGGMMALGLLLFSPWLLTVATNSDQVSTVTGWMTTENRPGLLEMVKLWGYHLSLSFVDRGELNLPLGLRLLFLLFQAAVRLTVLYALYVLWRYAPLRTWLFVALLIGIPALALTLPDLLLGGKRSTIPRYFVPVYLGLELAVVYLMQHYSSAGSASSTETTSLPPTKAQRLRLWRRFWQSAFGIVLVAGLSASVLIAQSPAWWNKGHHSRLLDLVAQINVTERPLVVSNAELGDLLALSHYLDPKARLLLQPTCFACAFNRDQDQLSLPEIPSGYSDVFLYNPRPSTSWLAQLEQSSQFETISRVTDNWYREYWLWKKR